MAKFSERFKQLRTERGLSQQDMANQLGFTKSRVNMYERGEREPGFDALETIADYFNVDMDFLLGKSDIPNRSSWVLSLENTLPLPNMRKVPLLGTIACGTPILAAENLDGYVNMPENIHADFCLKCKGDSMIGARIMDGDLVFIHQQPDVDNGAIAAVIVEDEATLKRIYKSTGKIILQPENPRYEPFVFVGEELSQIRIIGKAIAFLSGVE